MSSRLADRLRAARHSQFVGRATEQAIFSAALTAVELPFLILFIYGPGGVGKTTLLRQFAQICEQVQIPAVYLDARDLDPSPASFLHEIQLAMEHKSSEDPLQVLTGQSQRTVILIDTFEKLAPLEGWLREELLPQLSSELLVAVASRHPPSPAWRSDPGWQLLIRPLPLRNFTPEESLAYLTERAVPPEEQEAILDYTYGHPLALSLIADVFAQRGHIHFTPETTPDVIKILLEQLVQKVPGPAHRAALEACALVRMTTEPLLAAMLDTPDAYELFDWLRGLSCIDFGPLGLFPHDLARETLVADLHWRNPDWYAELHRRARIYYSNRLQQVQGQEQQTILVDYIFLHRDNPMVRPFFVQLQSQWQENNINLMVDIAHKSDWPTLKQLITKHEGAESARLAQHWFTHQPGGLLVLRDTARQPVGVLAMVALDQASTEQIDADPATRAAGHYLETHTPLRPGDKATHFRFWMAHNTYQAVSPIQGLIFVNMVRHYLTTPGLAFTFLPCAEVDYWAPVFTYANLTRLPEADFTVNERHYGVYGHDWRITPPTVWLELLADREVATNPHVTPPPKNLTPLVVLSQPDFTMAVHQALRDIRAAHQDALRHNPLLWSRLVTERAGINADEARRAATLQPLFIKAAERLQTVPRQVKLFKALYHTYFQPAPTQEQAAELLDLPYSTFRRHLKAGVAELTEILWQQEIGRLEK